MRAIFFILYIMTANVVYCQNAVIIGELINGKETDKQLKIDYLEEFLVRQKSHLNLDKEGRFKYNVELQESQLVNLAIDSFFFQLYVSPGATQFVSGDISSKRSFAQTLTFKGELSTVNQLLFDVQNNSKMISSQWSIGEDVDRKVIINKIDNYYRVKQKLIHDSPNYQLLSSEELAILKIDSIGDEYRRASALLNLLKKEGLIKKDASQFVEIHIDASILSDHGIEKTIPLVQVFWTYSYLPYLIDRDRDVDTELYIREGYFLNALKKIDTLFTNPLKDYMKASIIYDLLSEPRDFRPGVDSLVRLTEFFLTEAKIPEKSKAAMSYELVRVSNRAALKENSPAPSFTGLDMDGNRISMEDFKNKYVFIDVWASWCIPCIAQVPNVNKLIDELKDENIVFIMLSLDEDVDKWKDAIKKFPSKAIHLNLAEGFNGKFSEDYRIYSIPRYMLIKDSIILDSDLPLPSNANLLVKLGEFLYK